jgi:hypothetical protein
MRRDWRELRAEFHDVRCALRIRVASFRDETFLSGCLGEDALHAAKRGVPEAAQTRESRDHASGRALAERLDVNVALAAMDACGAADEFFGGHGRVGGIQRVAFGDQAAGGASAFDAQHAVDGKFLLSFEEDHVAGPQQFEIPAADENLIAAAHPREHVAIQDAHRRRTLRADLRANRIGVNLRASGRAVLRRDSSWRNG